MRDLNSTSHICSSITCHQNSSAHSYASNAHSMGSRKPFYIGSVRTKTIIKKSSNSTPLSMTNAFYSHRTVCHPILPPLKYPEDLLVFKPMTQHTRQTIASSNEERNSRKHSTANPQAFLMKDSPSLSMVLPFLKRTPVNRSISLSEHEARTS